MKLHIIGNPNVPTGLKNPHEPFSVLTYKFVENLKKKYEVVHYGPVGSEVSTKSYEAPIKNLPAFCEEVSRAIGMEKGEDDIILSMYGSAHRQAVQAHPELKVIEPSIGYHPDSVFAPYRAFTSYASMHYFYGLRGMLGSPAWGDAVIPNPISAHEFTFRENKDDYVLFFGRVIESKGIHIAIQATEKAGKKLVVAGPDAFANHITDLSCVGYSRTPAHVEVLGKCGIEQRRDLMANAYCLIAPTYYIEPFGNMVVEAQFSGTPVITSDWGAFAETNLNDITGYRCRNMIEFVEAIDAVGSLNKRAIRDRALARYEDSVVFDQVDYYIKRIARGGFYAE